MGTILVVPMIIGINKLVKLYKEINGKMWTYLMNLIPLLWRRRQHKTNRVVTHNVWKDNIYDSGIIPFPHEWQYDCPSHNKNEDIVIYGVNSSKQCIYITINWKPNGVNNKNNATINMRIDDNNDCYTLEETQEVEYRKGEYRVSGLGLEILSAFRRKRIKFRGYLLKNNKELVYIQFRFLWIAMSRVYDFTYDFDDSFLAKELTFSPKSHLNAEDILEDRLEQFGQIKGTFKEEKETERNIYFWGSMSKKYLTSHKKRNITRICGFTKKGIGFDIGFVKNDGNVEYRFGMLFNRVKRFHKLLGLTINKSDFESLKNGSNIQFTAKFDDKEYKFEIKQSANSFAQSLWIDDIEGKCIISEENETEFQRQIRPTNDLPKNSSLVLGLNEESAQRVDLTGGKGSSLAVLMNLSQQLVRDNNKHQFSVANGVVVTTNAYEILLNEDKELLEAIQALEKSPQKDLKTDCENLVNLISSHKLPKMIKQTIEEKLNNNFSDFENKLFAVRSSGASEDSEEMSAAGQMTTYLGVKGLDNIYSSVMKCWSSQFSHIAVEYKRGYGQPINSPMAVVIQEMIACESAGVMFTCDPITGDERVIEVTANYGLGESVVSASAEPDTIKLSVNIESNSLSKPRNIKSIENKVIGAKKTSIKLSENGGTVEEEINDNTNCCVSDEDLYQLGDLALIIHKHYGNVRDIEWGLKGGEIFMLQSRPVTNLDNSYTDYEIMHEMDSPHQTEYEIYSRAHWGENFPGASSWLVYTWTFANKSGFFRWSVEEGKATEDDYNPYTSGFGVQYNQLMFNMTNGFFDMFSEYPESDQAKQMVLAFFGHHIEDKDVLNAFLDTRKMNKKLSLFKKLKSLMKLIHMVVWGPKTLMKDKQYFMDEIKYDLVDNIKKFKTSKDILDGIIADYGKVASVQFKNHGPASIGSTLKHLLLRTALEGAQKNNPNFESDFNLMISSCNEVISAEVPNHLREIAKSIKDKEQFKTLSDEEALKVLIEGSDSASKKFKDFLEKHGHRGYREFDPMYLPWGEDPIPCIKNIKAILTGSEAQLEPKVAKSVDQVIDELKTKLSFTRKLLISKLLLPWSRSGVGYREISKYFMIWMNDRQKKGFRYLAKQMVADGLLPSTDSFFYLTSEEVYNLCNGSRDPLIMTRLRHRKRLYQKMNKYKFDEFVKGPEMIPRNFDERITIPTNTTGLVQMTGTPVSNGVVKARVCVAEDITDADAIQPGDILITYSTDIGWSPYFPLLSGIVTEIGGTISHGAVIAREYGIPSLIAIEGVCRTFKTGDICVLDIQSATITKVE
ncbi:prodigiosin synthesizing transferase PigC-like [Oppia nitens]|uniref:prodigiosin synthesizing transferase PigC-like n=1 Tax=Oppia nitens TaxID=1686743 RepID=UPI0023DC9A60|nr:prodigiosin synthesizing transferase PigC-like [Oppia nitens]